MFANACHYVNTTIGRLGHYTCSGWSAGEDALVLGVVMGILAATGLLLSFLLHHHYKHGN